MNMSRVSLTILLLAVICIGCKKEPDPSAKAPEPEVKELSKVDGISIQYSEGDNGTSWGSDFNGEYFAEGFAIEGIIKKMWPDGDIEVDKSSVFAGKKFDLKIKGNGNQESKEVRWGKFKNAFEKSFDISINKKTKVMDVKVLSRGAGDLKITKIEPRMGSSYGTSTNGCKFESYSIDEVAEVFEEKLGVKVINATGLEGKYDFEIKLDMYKPETYSAGFKELGLKLSDEKRELDVIVIEKTN